MKLKATTFVLLPNRKALGVFGVFEREECLTIDSFFSNHYVAMDLAGMLFLHTLLEVKKFKFQKLVITSM